MSTLGVLLVIAVMAAVLWVFSNKIGFQSQRPEDYVDSKPVFDIRERLRGKLLCEGVIFGPFGKVSSRFVAEFYAKWDGDTGVMNEVFQYDSGATQHRQWTLKLKPDQSIEATAPDVVGIGTGCQMGSVVQLNYTIKLTEAAGGHALNVTDWMYLASNGVIMNRSQFRKFGIKVAELVATMRPAEIELQQAAE